MNNRFFYIPALHPEVAALQAAPSAVNLLSPGLDSGSVENRASGPYALPLTPREAKNVLADLLAFGEEHAAQGALKAFAALHEAASAKSGSASHNTPHIAPRVLPKMLHDEAAALHAFAESGSFGDDDASPALPKQAGQVGQDMPSEDERRELVECQKMLLLAYSLEERNLEAQRAAKDARTAENALLSALSEQAAGPLGDSGLADELTSALADDDAALFEAIRGTAAQTPAPFSPPWRSVLVAAIPFVPEDAVFVSASGVVAAELAEAGVLHVPQSALCDEVAAALGVSKEGLLAAHMPAWKLSGGKACPAERPWLSREITILVLPHTAAENTVTL